jgi:hypothetical protein
MQETWGLKDPGQVSRSCSLLSLLLGRGLSLFSLLLPAKPPPSPPALFLSPPLSPLFPRSPPPPASASSSLLSCADSVSPQIGCPGERSEVGNGLRGWLSNPIRFQSRTGRDREREVRGVRGRQKNHDLLVASFLMYFLVLRFMFVCGS